MSNFLRYDFKTKIQTVEKSGGEFAETAFKLIKSDSEQKYSLVSAFPSTGRTHQIRVHFAAIDHPIVGDTVYGTSSKLIKRQALHAYKLSFFFKGKFFTFWHDMPEDMLHILHASKQYLKA